MFNLSLIADAHWACLNAERLRCGLNCTELPYAGGIKVIPKDEHSRYARIDLPKQLQPFPAYSEIELGKSGSVAAMMCETGDVTSTNRIGRLCEDDWVWCGSPQEAAPQWPRTSRGSRPARQQPALLHIAESGWFLPMPNRFRFVRFGH